MNRELSMEFVRVTEAAAIACGRSVGRGDKNGADQLAELEPAYAVTVHKSQGSEFPAVIMPEADVPARLCYRNLLYTGVTRARRLCILAGTRRTEQAMVDNVRQNMRYSGLRYLLREAVTPAEKRR